MILNSRKTAIAFLLLLCCVQIKAQKSGLKFNRDGKFKIIQFTDVHYKCDDKKNSQIALERINEVLDNEKPDFVIFTGDIVVSNESSSGFDTVLEPCLKRNIPFALVFGNHDDEYDHNRIELYDYVSKKRGAVMPTRKANNVPDYSIEIKSSKNTNKNSAVLYCFDSNSYTKINSVPGYDWIKFDQIGWYRDESKQYTSQNANIPIPALAFFHIPLPEYRDALLTDKNKVYGIKKEEVACPSTNSGLFTSIKECGDVMGVFVGHDHDNDYAVIFQDVLLAYGRYTGGNTVYNNLPNGARAIVLYEDERRFDSYICLANNQIETFVNYPNSYY